MDGALAWDIQKWVNQERDMGGQGTAPSLSTREVESLATFLSENGWGSAKRDVSLGDIKGLVNKARKFADDLLGEPSSEPGKPADRKAV